MNRGVEIPLVIELKTCGRNWADVAESSYDGVREDLAIIRLR